MVIAVVGVGGLHHRTLGKSPDQRAEVVHHHEHRRHKHQRQDGREHEAANDRQGHRRTELAAVAYREEDVRAFLERAGLELRGPIHFGGWCGREQALEGQDLLVLEKAQLAQGSRRR